MSFPNLYLDTFGLSLEEQGIILKQGVPIIPFQRLVPELFFRRKSIADQYPYLSQGALVFNAPSPVESGMAQSTGLRDWQCWIPELQTNLTLGFSEERISYRCSPSNLQHELIIKAIKGRSSAEGWRVLDATAGLMRESAVLAAAGFNVLASERIGVLAYLQNKSLEINGQYEYLKRLAIVHSDSLELMTSWSDHPAKQKLTDSERVRVWRDPPEVVYLDPMYAEGMKATAALKKEMVFLKTLNTNLGLEAEKESEAEFLQAACNLATKKVVVKRAPKAALLGGVKPSSTVRAKALRFDIYPV